MKHLCLALICFLWVSINSISGQWIYSQGFAAGTGTPELQRINVADHSFVRLTGMGDMGDIAFHPDQNLYGVIFDKVYLIDTVSSAFTEVYDIGDFQSVGMTIDYNGIMYFSGYNPNTNRNGIAVFNPALSTTQIVADFGPINQGFINDLEFYNGELFVVGELPSTFSQQAVLFRVDTSGFNQHDTIVQYDMWPGRALAAISDTCGSQYLVSPATSLLNYFYPPFDSIQAFNLIPPDGLFYSSGATSRSSHAGSIPALKITHIDISQDPCLGNSNATVIVQKQQGRPGSTQFSINGINYQDSNVFTNIPPGNYRIYIKDNWGCQAQESIEIIDIQTFPVTLELIPSTCSINNGQIIIHSEIPGLYYGLDNSAFSEDLLFANLAGGDHTLIIKNEAGCTDSIKVILDSYQAPSFEVIVRAEQCNAQNGEIEFITITGESPLQFSIDGIEWQNNSKFENLIAGSYKISIIDVFNCIVSEDLILPETGIPQIENINIIPEECGKADGQIEVTVISEHGPLQYLLNGIGFNNVSVYNNLEAGLYAFVATDTLGCNIEKMIEVPGNGGPVIAGIEIVDEHCETANGSIAITAVSDHGPLDYALNNGTFTTFAEFEKLQHGIYNIVVRDTNGCQQQSEIIVDHIDAIRIERLEIEDATCSIDNGSILILAANISSTEYSLDGQLFHTQPFFQNLTAGDYTAYLSSYEVCIDSAIFSVKGYFEPVITNVILVQPTCEKDEATIMVEAYGSGELIFDLDNGIISTNGHFTNLTEGLHLITITDRSGCRIDTSFSIVAEKCLFYMPNVFSPNGDGVNDNFGFTPEDEFIRIEQFVIYDRWGNQVYRCNDYDVCGWDGMIHGRPGPSGVYLYHISLTYNDEVRYLTGEVTLL